MNQDIILNRIADIEREISLLPEGNITKKNINAKVYYYLRINREGKRKETYVPLEEVAALDKQIQKRKQLEQELKELRSRVEPDKRNTATKRKDHKFNTIVRIGKRLESQIELTRSYKKRECISQLREYVFGDRSEKVFILYGLRRTGKTTMIRQILAELSADEFNKAAFIQTTIRDSIADIKEDLDYLEENGFKYVFIDEVTLIEDFVEGAALFSDIYGGSGMKIVLSGTDSLGFAFTKEEQLYDRCIMLHTTFIPYREFEEVLGIKGIDEYIRYGGTMSLGGVNYNSDTPFANSKTAEEYIDTAIAKNIQHSLKMYQYGGHFRGLSDLYEKGELTNVINRVVENINHSFTRNVVERTFRSHDISVTTSNLLRDKQQPINIKEHLDMESVLHGIKDMLDILDKEEQSIDIEDSHMLQIKEYLTLLDLITEIDVESLPEISKKSSMTVIAQPGLRYAQTQAIVENMLLDIRFKELSLNERQYIIERLLNEIKGRMMEEIVLLETKIANPDKHVFKLQFAIGEFDMVVFDPVALNCKIYEVKHSTEMAEEQYRHLIDEQKCQMTAHRYGEITAKFVIYRGEEKKIGDISYLNVEQYLKSFR